MADNTVVDMDNYDLDGALEELSRRRYAMPPVVIAALKQAGNVATQRLLTMITDDKTFEALSARDKMKLVELALDRAFGRAETATTNELGAARLNGGNNEDTDHAKELELIAQRAQAQSQNRRQLPSASEVLKRIDRRHNFSESGPYPHSENDGSEGGHLGPVPPTRNRPVPPQNVVSLRRASDE